MNRSAQKPQSFKAIRPIYPRPGDGFRRPDLARWKAIQSTYWRAYLAETECPNVALKDVFEITVRDVKGCNMRRVFCNRTMQMAIVDNLHKCYASREGYTINYHSGLQTVCAAKRGTMLRDLEEVGGRVRQAVDGRAKNDLNAINEKRHDDCY